MMTDINISVTNDMRLHLMPHEIARDAENNSATFRIVGQPSALDALVCRAEVQTAKGITYRLVDANGEFALTADIAVAGPGQLQLVYSNGNGITRKTSLASFHVSGSLNAVEPGSPDYPSDGIAQLQSAAFTAVVGGDNSATFYNFAGLPVGILLYPPGQGGGIDEAQGDLLYLRRDGVNRMTGSILMDLAGNPRGLVFDPDTNGGMLYSTGQVMVLRRPAGDADIVIEAANGAPVTRTPIITQQSGDARYLTPDGANLVYARRDGTQMTGPFISQYGSGNTNLGVSVGENSSGFWKSGAYLICASGGATAWQTSPTEILFGVRLNAASQPISNVADAVAAQDAVNRRTMDAAIAAVPHPTVPAARAYVANEVTILPAPQTFFDQPFFTTDNATRTIVVTVQPQFAAGTPSSFYDLEYTVNLTAGLLERTVIYPTAQAYMGVGAVCFAATVTPVSSQIQIQLSVRVMSSNPGNPLVQIGARADQRTTIVIQEMTN